MPARSGHDLGVVAANIESTPNCSFYLRWRSNLLASPLFRLPTELLLKIFVHAIEFDEVDQPLSLFNDSEIFDRYNSPSSDEHCSTLFVLTAICHHLRGIGIDSPQLWGTVDVTSPPVAKFFPERRKHDPHFLVLSQTIIETRSMIPIQNPRRDAIWKQLEGHTLNKLRAIWFEGTPYDFTRWIADVLRRASNISDLDFNILR